MRNINIRKYKSSPIIDLSNIDITDRQPCWYTHLSNGTNREKAVWTVGIKSNYVDNLPSEVKIKLSDTMDVSNNDIWNKVTSVEFATKMLDVYRLGTISSWIKGGCVLEISQQSGPDSIQTEKITNEKL